MTEIIKSIEEKSFASKFKDAYGTIEGYEIVTDRQVIRLGMNMDRDCCESPGYFMSEDDLSQFIGADLVGIETVDTCLVPEKLKDFYEGGTIFVNFKTNRGLLQFTAYNNQNGYYGHDAVVESEQLGISTTL